MAESAPLLRAYRLKTYRGFESLPLRHFVVAATVACLSLAGCDRQQPQRIAWQLPLEAPADPHGADARQELPDWAAKAEGGAELALLDKRTARVTPIPLQMGQSFDKGGLSVRLLGLARGLRIRSGAYIDDENVHNPAAFVEVGHDGKVAYRGWLYRDFPELFGPDLAGWKLWLKSVSIAAPPDADAPRETQRTRSSAG